MDLKREEIEKALDVCTSPDQNCFICPYSTIGQCKALLLAHANALIKELEDEGEKLRAELSTRPPRLIITKK